MKSPAHRGSPARSVFLLAGLLLLAGCATTSGMRGGITPDDGGGFGFLREPQDSFQLLQVAGGLEENSWHKPGEELEPEAAHQLWETVVRTRTTLRNFGPRRSLLFLLRQVIDADEDVPYADLLKRARVFDYLVVVRPDGYLVSAVTGKPLARGGHLALREGRLMSGRFEVGAFYWDRGGVLYAVDEALQKTEVSLGERGLEHDAVNAVLDGAEDALGELAQVLAQWVKDPVRSMEGLQQLPSAVAALIASSPAYFDRYSALPLEAQIREAARLSTHLLMLYGTAAGTAATIGSAAARVPVLSLTAEGALVVEQVAVPMGATAAALGTGAGAVYVLMAVEGGAKGGSSGGPGAGKRFSKPVKGAAEESAGGKCVFCDKETTRSPGPQQRNIDHAIPKSRGGNNTLDNAQNTCRTCNLDKGTKTTDEYLGGGG